MVTLNLTLIFELVLFLIFLWGTAVFILRPVLRFLDEREEKIVRDQSQAETDSEEAGGLEQRYAQEMSTVRRSADDEFRDKRRAALEAHATTLSEKRHQADEAVAQVREEAMTQVAGERGAYKSLAPGLADLISERLGMGGKSS